MEKIFLLGGRDLEMQTISKLLQNHNVTVIDKQLSWGAKLSSFQNELGRYSDSEKYQIYGIELEEDIPTPSNYHCIDHHNENCNYPSSIEQVADLLGHKLTRYEQLVAKNDSDHIEGMQSIGATEEEIFEIRLADRRAQGITDEEERLCEEAIKNAEKCGHVLEVKAPTHHFSPIADRLYEQKYLLVYTDDEFCYYCKDETEYNRVKECFNKAFTGKFYYGKRYIGVGKEMLESKEMKKAIDIITLPAISRHVFIFPFSWVSRSQIDNEDYVVPDYDISFLDEIENLQNRGWRKSTDNVEDIYTEKQYFFKHTHRGMYDTKGTYDLLRHFERIEAATKQQVKYVIHIDKKGEKADYKLDVDALNINIYATGIGTVMLYCSNNLYENFADVCAINQYGRRLIPQSAKYFGEMPDKIELQGLNGLTLSAEYNQENFQKTLLEVKDCSWQASDIMKRIVASLTSDIEITPVVDDRMFVLCTCGCDILSEQIKQKTYPQKRWYEYVFVDNFDCCSCQCEEMMANLLKEATYTRWQGYGTLYGVSRYSFVELSSQGYVNDLDGGSKMTTLYTRIYEMCIVQLASVLNFDETIEKLNNTTYTTLSASRLSQEVAKLYKSYIRFENSLVHIAVTEQDQGVELYDLLRKQMRIEEHTKHTDDMLQELHNYSSTEVERDRNEISLYLTIIATVFVLPSLVSSIAGMNPELLNPQWWLLIVVLLFVVSCFVGYKIYKKHY